MKGTGGYFEIRGTCGAGFAGDASGLSIGLAPEHLERLPGVSARMARPRSVAPAGLAPNAPSIARELRSAGAAEARAARHSHGSGVQPLEEGERGGGAGRSGAEEAGWRDARGRSRAPLFAMPPTVRAEAHQ